MKKETTKSPPTDYFHEEQTILFFVNLLEHRLAGRDKPRIIKRMPIDECQLGVLLPWRREIDEPDPIESDEVSDIDEIPRQEAKKANILGVTKELSADSKGETDSNSQTTGEQIHDQEYVRRPPSSLGAEFLIESDSGNSEIEVDVSFAIYTPHMPNYNEQISSLGEPSQTETSKGPMTLADVWQRRSVLAKGIRFRIPGSYKDDDIVQKELDKVIADALLSSDAMPEFDSLPKLSPEILENENNYCEWMSENQKNRPLRKVPLKAHIETRSIREELNRFRVSVYVRNDTLRGKNRSEDNYRIIGDTQLTIRIISGTLLPVEILPVPEDYQYDRKVWAVGHNASIEVSQNKREIKTQTLARIELPRLTTRDEPSAIFHDLDTDPFKVLERIALAMEDYSNEWEGVVLKRNILKLDKIFLEECRKDLESFRLEMNRFCCGIASLQIDPRLLEAFRAMNRIMSRIATGYDRWRLFQIVFIVTQLPAMTIREGQTKGEWPKGYERNWEDELEWADVLWFPTGGGKTEAYLGMVSCAILYDRLRGKNCGITAWLRFPLRMLSIQQLQRAMKMVWETERERQTIIGIEKGDPVTLGYFIGGTTTPNRLDDRFFQRHSDASSCEKLRVVTDCPNCGAKDAVQAIPDKNKSRLRHVCKICRTELPLFVTDSEIYRYLPSLIIGTVDKMATVGFQTRFGILWSGPKWKCPEHGYSLGQFCEVYGCKSSLKKGKLSKLLVSAYDPSPSFHVQDELHLLQEELGAFAGHYETLVRYCEESASIRPAKVIAATATIEGYEHQARHLYGVKGSRRFPGRGYKRYESFYSMLEMNPDNPLKPKIARMFVAFRPPSGATADIAGKCALILHEEIAKWIRNPYEALASLPFLSSINELRNILNFYSATLTYVNSLPSGTRIKDLLGRQSSEIHKELRDLNVEYLSSRSSSSEVSSVIHRMEQPPEWEDQNYLDAIVATNMISHGVDLERVNLMLMDKFPAEIAEYIQASSRSGRKKVGLVTVILPGYNLRAASIYNRFREYHQHLDRMVSPVPVNRFAKYAVQRTLSGILSGLIFGRIAPDDNDLSYNKLRKSLLWIEADRNRIEEMLRYAYSIGKGIYEQDLEDFYGRAIREQFESLLITLRASQEEYLTNALRPKPMSSLRDVERGIPFYPNSDDPLFLHWFRKDIN